MHHYFQDRSIALGKRARTRSTLIDGTIAAVAEKGLGEVSIKEITSRVGLANGTFYNHFGDLDEVIRESAYAIAEVLAGEIAESVADEEDGVHRIILSTDAFIRRAQSEPHWASMIVDAARRYRDVQHDAFNYLRADIALATEQGAIAGGANRFLLEQIGALVILALDSPKSGGANRAVRRQTSEAVLKLLGLAKDQAESAVETVLGSRSRS